MTTYRRVALALALAVALVGGCGSGGTAVPSGTSSAATSSRPSPSPASQPPTTTRPATPPPTAGSQPTSSSLGLPPPGGAVLPSPAGCSATVQVPSSGTITITAGCNDGNTADNVWHLGSCLRDTNSTPSAVQLGETSCDPGVIFVERLVRATAAACIESIAVAPAEAREPAPDGQPAGDRSVWCIRGL